MNVGDLITIKLNPAASVANQFSKQYEWSGVLLAQTKITDRFDGANGELEIAEGCVYSVLISGQITKFIQYDDILLYHFEVSSSLDQAV